MFKYLILINLEINKNAFILCHILKKFIIFFYKKEYISPKLKK